MLGEFGVFGLLGQFLRPVHGQIELAATVVELTGFPRRALVVVEESADRGVHGLAEQGRLLVVRLAAHVLEAGAQRQEFTQ